MRAGLITGLLLLCVVIAVGAHFGKGEEFAKLVQAAKPQWLGVALVLQAATYVCAGAVWFRALARQGQEVRTTGKLLQVPAGKALLGRVVNVLGQPVDGKGPIKSETTYPVEKIAPGIQFGGPDEASATA